MFKQRREGSASEKRNGDDVFLWVGGIDVKRWGFVAVGEVERDRALKRVVEAIKG